MAGDRRFLERVACRSRAVGTWPQITTIGIESAMQSRTGVTVFVAPGPDVTSTRRRWPLARA